MDNGRFGTDFLLGNYRNIINQHQSNSVLGNYLPYTLSELDALICSSHALGMFADAQQFCLQYEYLSKNIFSSLSALYVSITNKQDFSFAAFKSLSSSNPPPQLLKVWHLLMHAYVFNCNCLIETGTYMGSTPHLLHQFFEKIYSIECSSLLYEIAKKRLSHLPNIDIFLSGSNEWMRDMLPQITFNNGLTVSNSRYLFWLDAHYSGGITGRSEGICPLLIELQCILEARYDLLPIILIDDSRFILESKQGYPSLSQIEHLVGGKYRVHLSLDALCLYPIIN